MSDTDNFIPIYQPYLTDDILKFAHDAIDSKWISSLGKYKDMSTTILERMLGADVLLVSSGTDAVHLMARALKYKYPNIRNIIVPNNVYVAAWNGFLFDKEYTLIPVDADIDTWNMDIGKIPEHNPDDTAILVVHNIGNIVNVPLLKRRYPKTVIVEDACEGFLGTYEGKPVGTEAFCSSISFFGNKSITAGEGGAFITKDKDVLKYVNKLHGQGQSDIRYLHDELGYNYRMTNIQAAILYGQLIYLPKIMEEKNRVFDLYKKLIVKINNVQLQTITEYTTHSNWFLGVRIMNMKKSYSHLEKYFKSKGIDLRPMFYPMSKHPYLSKVSNEHREEIAKVLSDECCMLPSYPQLNKKQITHIVATLVDYCENKENFS